MSSLFCRPRGRRGPVLTGRAITCTCTCSDATELVQRLERVSELRRAVWRQFFLLEAAPAPKEAAVVEHIQAARLQCPVGT